MPERIEVASGSLIIWGISDREFSFHRLKNREAFVTVTVTSATSKPILFRVMATSVLVPNKL